MKELTPQEIIREMDMRFTCKTHAADALGIKKHILRALSARAKGGSGYPRIENRKNLVRLALALGFPVIDPEKIYIQD